MGIDVFSKSEKVESTNTKGFSDSSFDPDKRLDVSSKAEKTDSNRKEYMPDGRIFANKEQSEISKDDNGKVYRVGDNLVPNNTYEINGYSYKTDSHGRIVSTEGKLQMKDHDGRKEISDSMDKIGKGDQKASDDRGHLIADRFNGSEKMGNIVSMDGNLNKGDYKKMEDKLADAVKDGKDVTLKVRPIFMGDSFRPTSFRITYTIDGCKTVVTFKNGGESTK